MSNEINDLDLVRTHSGSTLVNLCLTGTPNGGWEFGTVSNVIGDHSTGKTLIAIKSCQLASELIDKCDVHYVDVERSIRSTERLKKLNIDPDSIGLVTSVTTIEDFEKFFSTYIKSRKIGDGKKAFIVLDSYDSLSSEDEEVSKAGYGTERTRKLSQFFRKYTDDIRDLNIHLQIISQVRENLNANLYEPKKVRTGGKSLGHNVASEMWISHKKKLKDATSDLQYGDVIKCKVTKSRLAKPNRDADVCVLYDKGVDDTRSMLLWIKNRKNELVNSKGAWWYINDDEDKKGYHLDDIIRHIEGGGLYKDLVNEVSKAWVEGEEVLEEKTSSNRKDILELLK